MKTIRIKETTICWINHGYDIPFRFQITVKITVDIGCMKVCIDLDIR